LTNIEYLHCRGFISYQHAALTAQNEIKFGNIFDDVFADRMNTGLDWVWVEILTVMTDLIGLDFKKWTHVHLYANTSTTVSAVQRSQHILVV